MIPEMNAYIGKQSEVHVETIPDSYFTPFFSKLFNHIQIISPDQSDEVINEYLHLLTLITCQSLPQFNDFLNQSFFSRLIEMAQKPQFLMNSLWCIANLVHVSQYTFTNFVEKYCLFQMLSDLCKLENNKILTLCAVILKNAANFITHKSADNVISFFIQDVIEIIKRHFEVPTGISIQALFVFIEKNGNFMETQTMNSFMTTIFSYINDFSSSDDTYLFGCALSLLLSLFSTHKLEIYNLLFSAINVLLILKKGLYIPEPEIQCSTCKALSMLINNVPKSASAIKESGIAISLLETANSCDFSVKKNLCKTICHFFYSEEHSEIASDIIQNGGIFFIIEQLQSSGDNTHLIINVLSIALDRFPGILPNILEFGIMDSLDERIYSDDDEFSSVAAQALKDKLIEMGAFDHLTPHEDQ